MENPKYELIARYLEGDLQEEERKRFEKKLQDDPGFAEDVRLYSEIENNLNQRFKNQKEEQALRASLNKLKDEIKPKPQGKVRLLHKSYPWLVAAGMALLIGLFVFRNKEVSYADYAQHPKMEVSVRGSSSDILQKAQRAFNTRDYRTASLHLSRLSQYYLKNTEIQLFYGISLLETDQYDMANMVFKRIAEGDSLLKEEARWYLALTALKQNDKEACKAYLSAIPSGSDAYDKAQSLLKKLP